MSEHICCLSRGTEKRFLCKTFCKRHKVWLVSNFEKCESRFRSRKIYSWLSPNRLFWYEFSHTRLNNKSIINHEFHTHLFSRVALASVFSHPRILASSRNFQAFFQKRLTNLSFLREITKVVCHIESKPSFWSKSLLIFIVFISI